MSSLVADVWAFDPDSNSSVTVDAGDGSSAGGPNVITSLERISQGPLAFPFRGAGRASKVRIVDKDRIITASEPAFEYGLAATRKFFDIIELRDPLSPGSLPANAWERWDSSFEGREIQIFSDDQDSADGRTQDKTYEVRQWIDDHHLRIGRALNIFTGEHGEAYNGATGTFKYRIRETRPGFRYSAKTFREGTRPDYFPARNFIPTPGEPTAMGIAQDHLVIWTRERCYRTLQIEGAFDDVTPTAYGAVEEIPTPEGCIAPRTVTRIPATRVAPDAELIALGADGGILIGGAFGFTLLKPASERLRSFLTTFGVIDAERMRHAHAYYVGDKAWWVVILINEDAIEPDCDPEGSKFDFAAPIQDFFRGFYVDLKTGLVGTLIDQAWSANLRLTEDCVGSGELLGKVFLGGTRGYIYEANREDQYSLGGPDNEIEFQVAANVLNAGDSASLVTSGSHELFTTGDGVSGLTMIHIAAGVETRYVVQSNTANTIKPVGGWAPLPLQGQLIRLAPLRFTVWYPWMVFRSPARLHSLLINATYPADFKTGYQFNIAAATGKKPFGDFLNVQSQNFFENDRIEEGEVYLRAAISRALQLQTSFVHAKAGKVEFHSIRVEADVAQNERGASGLTRLGVSEGT